MFEKQVLREASHAGSWYTDDGKQLSRQLDGWLDAVETPVEYIGPLSRGSSASTLPVPGARVIIGPHAGYSYSGAAAAFAYKAWDLSNAKRVFLLGPSHHFYLTKAALSRCTHYQTPIGNLKIDAETTMELSKTGQFDWLSKHADEDEHSLEMHLPYIYKMLSRVHKSSSDFPLLVPIMIGSTSAKTEASLGQILAPYLADPSTAFVVSSDFAHWGSRFRYTHYRSDSGTIKELSSSDTARNPPIHESIKAVDFECMEECESGQHDRWLAKLGETGNTVCGRHPIGVMMAAIEEARKQSGNSSIGEFKFVRYERSSLVTRVGDSSVSYASAFAVI